MSFDWRKSYEKMVSVFLPLLILFCSVALPVSAVSEEAYIVVSRETIYNEDGSYYIVTIKESPAALTRSGASKIGSKVMNTMLTMD